MQPEAFASCGDSPGRTAEMNWHGCRGTGDGRRRVSRLEPLPRAGRAWGTRDGAGRLPVRRGRQPGQPRGCEGRAGAWRHPRDRSAQPVRGRRGHLQSCRPDQPHGRAERPAGRHRGERGGAGAADPGGARGGTRCGGGARLDAAVLRPGAEASGGREPAGGAARRQRRVEVRRRAVLAAGAPGARPAGGVAAADQLLRAAAAHPRRAADLPGDLDPLRAGGPAVRGLGRRAAARPDLCGRCDRGVPAGRRHAGLPRAHLQHRRPAARVAARHRRVAGARRRPAGALHHARVPGRSRHDRHRQLPRRRQRVPRRHRVGTARVAGGGHPAVAGLVPAAAGGLL